MAEEGLALRRPKAKRLNQAVQSSWERHVSDGRKKYWEFSRK
jgi:hypothetical protein